MEFRIRYIIFLCRSANFIQILAKKFCVLEPTHSWGLGLKMWSAHFMKFLAGNILELDPHLTSYISVGKKTERYKCVYACVYKGKMCAEQGIHNRSEIRKKHGCQMHSTYAYNCWTKSLLPTDFLFLVDLHVSFNSWQTNWFSYLTPTP